MKTLRERFFQKVEIPEDKSQCWIWIACLSKNGYGKIGDGPRDSNKTLVASRVSWELHRGTIPDGKFVLHHCDNRKCVNPDHLWIGDSRDNILDCIKKGRRFVARTRTEMIELGMIRFGESHPQSKLTEGDVKEIRSIGGAVSQRELGIRFGVEQTVISAILLRKTWKHVQ